MCHPIFLLWKNEQSTVLFIGAIWTKTFKSNFPTDSVYKLFRLDYYFKKIHHVTNRLVKRYLQFSARYQFQRTSSSGPLKILHVPTYMYLPTCTYLHVPSYMYLPTCTYLHLPTYIYLPTCTYLRTTWIKGECNIHNPQCQIGVSTYIGTVRHTKGVWYLTRTIDVNLLNCDRDGKKALYLQLGLCEPTLKQGLTMTYLPTILDTYLNLSYFFKKWACLCLLSSFFQYNDKYSTIFTIKHRWCALYSNPGLLNGWRRRIHWAMAAPIIHRNL